MSTARWFLVFGLVTFGLPTERLTDAGLKLNRPGVRGRQSV